MIIIIWTVMKSYKNFSRHFGFKITNTMGCASLFACVMTMMSDFSITYIFSIFFGFLFHKYSILLNLHVILILFLLTITFSSFQNQWFFTCSFKESQNFFIKSFSRYKVCLFSYMWWYAQIVNIKYPKEIWSHISVVEDYSHTQLFFN